VTGNWLDVRRKMKENNKNLMKIEASLIKRLMRMSSWIFISSVLELSFSLSISYS